MHFNGSGHVKSNENTSVFPANLPHDSKRAVELVQQSMSSFVVPTNSSQVCSLQPPEKVPERTTDAPANFPHTNPPSLPVNATTTPSLFAPTRGGKAAGPKCKRGRPAKRFAPLPEIPFYPRLNLAPVSRSESGRWNGYSAAAQHAGPSSSQATPNAPANVDWGAYIRLCDQYAAQYITGVNNGTSGSHRERLGGNHQLENIPGFRRLLPPLLEK